MNANLEDSEGTAAAAKEIARLERRCTNVIGETS